LSSNSDGTRRTLRVGLTGGIACGKSNILTQFARLGAAVIDADQVARKVVEPGRPAYIEVVETFGEEVLRPDRSLDRKRLGALVFGDTEARLRLNRILHPRILQEEDDLIAMAEATGARMVVIDAALMIEVGTYHRYSVIIVAFCSPATQLERIIRRDGLSLEEAQKRLASQVPVFRKLSYADFVIDTSGSHLNTLEQVRQVHRELLLKVEQADHGRPR